MSVSRANIKSSELNELLVNCSIDRVMAINSDWEIIAWNTTSEMATGLDRQSILGKPLLELFPRIADDAEMIKAIERAFGGYKTFVPSSPERFNRHQAENHFIPLKGTDGEIIGVMNIMHDVAHRIKAEMQLEELNGALERKYHQLHEANHSFVSFINIASHEIQEPIRSIYTSLEMLAQKEGQALSSWGRGSVRKMQASLNRINLLLADLLSISTVSQPKEKSPSVDLNKIMDKALNELNHTIKTKDPVLVVGQLPTICGYPDLLKYLFHQVIENALKFQPQDQRPSIEISYSIAENNGKKYLTIRFADNGIGLDPSETESIFEMFKRLHPEKFKGSGIGLALCRKIMDLHGGSIYAKINTEGGTSFYCVFQAPE